MYKFVGFRDIFHGGNLLWFVAVLFTVVPFPFSTFVYFIIFVSEALQYISDLIKYIQLFLCFH